MGRLSLWRTCLLLRQVEDWRMTERGMLRWRARGRSDRDGDTDEEAMRSSDMNTRCLRNSKAKKVTGECRCRAGEG